MSVRSGTVHKVPIDPNLLQWMLDSDPALRWRVERDLAGEPQGVWQATRAKVATEGFGARLLALQDPNGQWAGGAFFPAGWDWDADEPQPWVATTWTLNLLREWGVDRASMGRTAELLKEHSRWEYDDLPYWGGEVDVCINAWTLMNGVWLGVDMSELAQWFVDHRLPDGGWNCEWVEGSTRSSYHSTLNALTALLHYETEGPDGEAVREARRGGEEYLLERHLIRRLSTGEQVAPWVTRFTYPLRWRYDVLRAVDHFRAASMADGTPPDPRLAEAVELIRAARQGDGTWMNQGRDPGRVWFEVDVEAGTPSKWVTYYATRVLEWWDTAQS
jgi:hypothetical protein